MKFFLSPLTFRNFTFFEFFKNLFNFLGFLDRCYLFESRITNGYFISKNRTKVDHSKTGHVRFSDTARQSDENNASHGLCQKKERFPKDTIPHLKKTRIVLLTNCTNLQAIGASTTASNRRPFCMTSEVSKIQSRMINRKSFTTNVSGMLSLCRFEQLLSLHSRNFLVFRSCTFVSSFVQVSKVVSFTVMVQN